MTKAVPFPGQSTVATDYPSLPLYTLLRLIVDDANPEALAELHNRRTVFQQEAGQRMLFTQYLHSLRSWALSRGWSHAIVEGAADLCQERFSRLPADGQGVDCRNYFRAVLIHFTGNDAASIGREYELARLLERMVFRHFSLCLKEVKRSLHSSRYVWRMDSGTLTLRFPRHISGRARLAWLEEHAPDADAARVGERDRIQALVDAHFGSGEPVSLDDGVGQLVLPQSDIPSNIVQRLESQGLAQAVAEEKADRIDEQRSAIAALGPLAVREMVLRIFEEIAAGEVNDHQIAQEYGITKPTYSRWAGSSWEIRRTAGS